MNPLKHALIVATDPPAPGDDGARDRTQVGGISVLARLLRTLRDLGIESITVLLPLGKDDDWVAAQANAGTIRVVHHPGPIGSAAMRSAWPPGGGLCLVVLADRILDRRLVTCLLDRAEPVALIDSQSQEGRSIGPDHLVGAALLAADSLDDPDSPANTPDDKRPPLELLARAVARRRLATLDVASLPTYAANLRRHLRPQWFVAPSTRAQTVAVERQLLDATKKGAPDIPAIVHGPMERFLVGWIAPTGITPNQITLFSTALAWVATYLLATGRLGPGLGLALIVGVLDGVDGRLARFKLQTSKLGELEHHLDAGYEISWWVALAYHFHHSGQLPNAWLLLLAWAAAEAVDGIAKLAILRRFGRTIDEMGRFDRVVRLFGGRRNVYVWIMVAAALLGNPGKGFALIPWWESVTALIHVPRAWWLLRTRSA